MAAKLSSGGCPCCSNGNARHLMQRREGANCSHVFRFSSYYWTIVLYDGGYIAAARICSTGHTVTTYLFDVISASGACNPHMRKFYKLFVHFLKNSGGVSSADSRSARIALLQHAKEGRRISIYSYQPATSRTTTNYY